MKGKKVIALLLAIMLTLAMAACGNSEKAPAASDTPKSSTATESKRADMDTQSPENAAEDSDDEDTAEIEVMFWTLNTVPTDLQDVEDAINKITEAKINTRIHMNIIEMGNYIQQVNLMISGGEKLDLMVTLPGGSAHFNSMASQKQLMDITELLDQYAPELKQIVPENWFDATMIDGKIYSVTSFGDKVGLLNFVCRTDILEETGIDIATIKTFNDLEPLFEKVKELHPEMVPVAPGSKKVLGGSYFIGSDGKLINYDSLGDGDNALIGLMDADGTTIKNNYLRDEYLETCQRLKTWYDNGWIYKDGSNYAEPAESLIQSNVAFSYFVAAPMDAKATRSAACGHDMTLIPMEDKALLGTSAFRKFTWAVPTTSTEPEAAVKFLNFLYSDAQIVNLITWGIEGAHYQVCDDGSIDFLDGEDASTCGYFIGDETAILGNGFLAKVRKGQSPDLRARSEEANRSAEVSKFNGFSFDSTGYENQISAITNTVEEYRPSFACGLYSEEYYNEFIKKLTENGAEEYINYIQEQLNTWLKGQQ